MSSNEMHRGLPGGLTHERLPRHHRRFFTAKIRRFGAADHHSVLLLSCPPPSARTMQPPLLPYARQSLIPQRYRKKHRRETSRRCP